MTCRLPSCPNEAVSVVTVPSQRGPFDCAYCDRHTLAALRAGATMTDRAPDEHANTPTTDPAMPATPSDPATVQTCSAPDCSRPVKARALCSKHYDVAWKASRAALAPASAPVIGTATGTDASADRAESVAQVNDGASDDLLRLRNNLRSAMGIPVADGSDARIVETVRTLVATNVLQDGAAAFDRRIAKGEIDTLREQLAVSERHRLATIADREAALNERDEARAVVKACFGCAPIDTATAIEFDGDVSMYLRNTIGALRSERDTFRDALHEEARRNSALNAAIVEAKQAHALEVADERAHRHEAENQRDAARAALAASPGPEVRYYVGIDHAREIAPDRAAIAASPIGKAASIALDCIAAGSPTEAGYCDILRALLGLAPT